MLPRRGRASRCWTLAGAVVARLERRTGSDLFEGLLPGRTERFDYRLRVRWDSGVEGVYADPYAYGPLIADDDLHFLAEGTHVRPYEVLGALPVTLGEGEHAVAGVRFAVWAPNARRVSVVGDFNNWDGRRHLMRARGGSGVWEMFVPHLVVGDRYKYEIVGPDDALQPLKADPYARAAQLRPDSASLVAALPPRRALPAVARGHERPPRAGLDLRGAPGLVAAPRQRRLQDLGRAGRRAAGLRGRPRLHARGADAHHRVPVRRLVGLPDAGPVRAHRALRPARGLRALRRRLPRQGHRRDPRLGAGAFPGRRPRPGALRRHRAVRVRGSARGLPSRLEHLHLQLRPPRGAQLPGRQRAVLDRALSASTACAWTRSRR